MNNRRVYFHSLIVSIVLLLSGCGIFSIHPLYHEEELIVMNELIGIWQDATDEKVTVMIDTIGDGRYKFLMDDKGDSVEFVMGLVKLRGQYYIDLFPPDDCGLFGEGGDDCSMLENMFRNYIPAHSFMKLDYQQDEITLTGFDYERLLEIFKQNRIRLAHELAGTDKDMVVITASTDDLQKFIARYSNDEDAFDDPDTYFRL